MDVNIISDYFSRTDFVVEVVQEISANIHTFMTNINNEQYVRTLFQNEICHQELKRKFNYSLTM